jgi:putative ABC transport system permease protein
MLRFLVKGVFRDRSRSLFSIIVITLIVALTVLIRGFMAGIFNDVFRQSAVIYAGHVKVTTRAYAEEADLLPNDLAILGSDSLVTALSEEYPDMFWTPRILFAGLLDIPDEQGETKEQGPDHGWSRSGSWSENWPADAYRSVPMKYCWVLHMPVVWECSRAMLLPLSGPACTAGL